jgi:hypothetical protein
LGSSFFKGGAGRAPTIGTGNMNQMARAEGTGAYGARGAGIAAQKSLGGAQAANKAAMAAHGPLKRSAAYPKGPVT